MIFLTILPLLQNPIPMVVGYGILRYDGAPKEDPVSSGKVCTNRNPCRVVNCIFGYFYLSLTTLHLLLNVEHTHKYIYIPTSTVFIHHKGFMLLKH